MGTFSGNIPTILEPNKWDKYWILFVLMSGGITYLLSGGNLMYIENKFDVHPIAFYVSGITGTSVRFTHPIKASSRSVTLGGSGAERKVSGSGRR